MQPYDRVVVVADWRADARAVTTAVERRAAESVAVFSLVVPAWLHGLDWIGDPYASRPCAHAQLETLRGLWAHAELPLVSAQVGDPDPLAAVGDAIDGWPASEVLLVTHSANPAAVHPFAIARRIERATGLPTRRVPIGPRRARRERFAWIRRGGRHCTTDAALA